MSYNNGGVKKNDDEKKKRRKKKQGMMAPRLQEMVLLRLLLLYRLSLYTTVSTMHLTVMNSEEIPNVSYMHKTSQK